MQHISPQENSDSLWSMLSKKSRHIADHSLSKIETLDDWNKQLPQRRSQYRCSLGLEPFPQIPHGLQILDYGEYKSAGFRARKIAYQILPDCWASGIIHYPDPLPEKKCPAILYNCGHTQTGSHHFQAHPQMWARRGYVCMIIDSIEQNDNTGEHHAFVSGHHHARLALGITASGLEVFNAKRALDILAADSAVDPERLGVTGVSGGGAMSFFLAALDERIRAVSTLCGICSPYDAVANRHIIGHCDCMFTLNLHGQDSADIAALIAPRAALFCFGNQDALYHMEECHRFTDKAHQIWKLHGKDQLWKRVEVACQHGDHPDFDVATQNWFDTHLAGEERPLIDRGEQEVPEKTTSVFNGCAPSPNKLHILQDLLVTRGSVPLPQDITDWAGIRQDVKSRLAPSLPPSASSQFNTPKTWKNNNQTISESLGIIEGMSVSLASIKLTEKPSALVLCVNTGGEIFVNLRSNTAAIAAHSSVERLLFETRLSGWNYRGVTSPHFPAGSRIELDSYITKAMTIVGLTPVAILLQDILAAIAHIRNLAEYQALPITLYAKGDSAVAAALAAFLDDVIAGVILEDLPASFNDRATLLGALRIFDIPQLIGLIAPRQVCLINAAHANWTWPLRAYQRLGFAENYTSALNIGEAAARLF